jgi:translation initiation factor IF-1
VKIQSDLHGDMQSQTEMIWPSTRKFEVECNNVPKVDARIRARVCPCQE